jgi:Tfp pilus assembly protein PilV
MRNMRSKLLNISRIFDRGQRGISLVEAMVSVALLGGGILTLVMAMSSGVMAVKENDQQSIGQGLARAQLEYTKSYVYNPSASSYPIINAPEGYSLEVSVASVPDTNNNLQKITTDVYYNSAVVVTAEDYKVNR